MPGIPLLNFYDKVMVPMGDGDRRGYEKGLHKWTHWLIGLVWNEEEASTGWKVFIYPTCEEDPFWRAMPYYQTEAFYSFDIALKISCFLERLAQKDALTTRSLAEEIKVHAYL